MERKYAGRYGGTYVTGKKGDGSRDWYSWAISFGLGREHVGAERCFRGQRDDEEKERADSSRGRQQRRVDSRGWASGSNCSLSSVIHIILDVTRSRGEGRGAQATTGRVSVRCHGIEAQPHSR